MFQKKPILFILTISIAVVFVSVLTIIYLGKKETITKKTESKNKTTIDYSKRKHKENRKIIKKKKISSIEKILSKLKLSETQKLKIMEIKKERTILKEKRKKIKELKKKLEQAFRDNTSYEEILSLYEKIQNLETQIDSVKFKYILEIRKILTPEQKKKFQKLRKRYKRRSKKKKS